MEKIGFVHVAHATSVLRHTRVRCVRDPCFERSGAQVEDDPSVATSHCEGAFGWASWLDFSVAEYFRGDVIDITPSTQGFVVLPPDGSKYRFSNVRPYCECVRSFSVASRLVCRRVCISALK